MNEEYPELSISRQTIHGKPVFEIEVNTIINFDTAFIHKLLCTVATFSLGSACVFSCAYCYVEAIVRKHPAVVRLMKELAKQGLKFHEVVVVRIAALDILREQLTVKKPKGIDLQTRGVIYTSPLVDPAGNLAQAKQTADACSIILELTAWDIRILSKSNLLPEIAKRIPERHRHRLIYGVSTGTLDDHLANAIEGGTALVSKRLASLHWLQDQGFRNFGMICPSLPQIDYDAFAADMAAAIRAERCEHVWAEVLNVRGESMSRTHGGLRAAGSDAEAGRLELVCGPGKKQNWEQYARDTFLAHTKFIAPEKLRFLQYVTPQTRDWWMKHSATGAVSLGTAAEGSAAGKRAEL